MDEYILFPPYITPPISFDISYKQIDHGDEVGKQSQDGEQERGGV
jgi:hypothetical protein